MKAILHYLILVGLPILGILGLLQLGSSLTAPASIGGVWQLQPANAEEQAAGCANLFDPATNPTLLILQSGIYLQLDINTTEKLKLTGKLAGLEIVAEGEGVATTAAVFQATINPQSDPDTLTSTLVIPDCTVLFTGLRLPDDQTTTGEH